MQTNLEGQKAHQWLLEGGKLQRSEGKLGGW